MDEAMLDRAAGALCGLAAGDAAGAPWEFGQPAPEEVVEPRGGGPFRLAPGEWTDDTAQAVAIAEVAAAGPLDPLAVGRRFLGWYAGRPVDVGASTAVVLGAAIGDPARLASEAAGYFRTRPNGAAGNGSLMRTAPVALAHLGDDDAIVAAATELSLLTHGDPLAAEGCVLWCIAIDRAVREQRLDGVRDGLDLLQPASRGRWADALAAAESQPPASFRDGNGYVVTALQAAWSAITHTPVPSTYPAAHLRLAIEAAVRVGGDTDTVAAITGQLVGARWGASQVPAVWRDVIHGWPGLRFDDLRELATAAALRSPAAG